MVNHLWHFRVSALGFCLKLTFETCFWVIGVLTIYDMSSPENQLHRPWASEMQVLCNAPSLLSACPQVIFLMCHSHTLCCFFCFVLGTAHKLYFKSEHLKHICQFCWKFLKLFVSDNHRNLFVYVSVSSICVCMCVRDHL